MVINFCFLRVSFLEKSERALMMDCTASMPTSTSDRTDRIATLLSLGKNCSEMGLDDLESLLTARKKVDLLALCRT